MISIPRSFVRQYRAVVRTAGLEKRLSAACVRITTTGTSMTLRATNGRVAVEHRSDGQFDMAEISIPFQLLADCEARSNDPVSLRIENGERIIATWTDRGLPQQRDYIIPANAPEMPALSGEFTANPAHLLKALRDAVRTVDCSSSRYALHCVQLRGTTGAIVATDSRQLLVQSGFRFPWQDDVLMQVSPVFASRELPQDSEVSIGRTETGVTVRIDGWTIHHELELKGRFPQVDNVIPAPTAIATRMQLDVTDASFLADTLGRLPANELGDRPVTLELNGEVVVRARKDPQSPMTELLLHRSHRLGDQLRVHTNREYLARAIELGFREVGFVDADSPCICQDAMRTYVWGLLDKSSALEASTDTLRIDSSSVPARGTAMQKCPIKAVESVDVPPLVASPEVSVASASDLGNRISARPRRPLIPESTPENRMASLQASTPTADIMIQTLDLRDQLRKVVQGLTELVGQIRLQRKHSRLMKSTLQSLQQLQLLDA